MPKTKTTKANSTKKELVKRIGEDLSVSDGKYEIFISYDFSEVRIRPNTGNDKFYFKDSKSKATIKKWRAIIKLMETGLSYLEGVVN